MPICLFLHPSLHAVHIREQPFRVKVIPQNSRMPLSPPTHKTMIRKIPPHDRACLPKEFTTLVPWEQQQRHSLHGYWQSMSLTLRKPTSEYNIRRWRKVQKVEVRRCL